MFFFLNVYEVVCSECSWRTNCAEILYPRNSQSGTRVGVNLLLGPERNQSESNRGRISVPSLYRKHFDRARNRLVRAVWSTKLRSVVIRDKLNGSPIIDDIENACDVVKVCAKRIC